MTHEPDYFNDESPTAPNQLLARQKRIDSDAAHRASTTNGLLSEIVEQNKRIIELLEK